MLNARDTYIINFDKVFPNGFKYGFNQQHSKPKSQKILKMN